MFKKLGWLILVSLLVLASLLGLFFFLNKSQIFQQRIKVNSAVPGFKVSFNDKDTLEYYLERTNFWQKGALLYDQGRRFLPEKLVIELTDQPQQYHQAFHPDNLTVPSFSIGWQIDETKKEYTLVVHLTGEVWQWDQERLSRQIDTQVIAGILYITKDLGELGRVGSFQTPEDTEIIKQVSSADKRIFKVVQAQSWREAIIKNVYAGIPPEENCEDYGGSYETIACSVTCGSWRQVCECSTTGEACSTAGVRCGSLPAYGTCECNSTGCVGSDTTDCTGSSCGAVCAECQVSGTCNETWACVFDSSPPPPACDGVCCAAAECTGPISDGGACAAANPATPSCCGICTGGGEAPPNFGPSAKFAIWYYYDADGAGYWDTGESLLDPSVVDGITVDITVPWNHRSYTGSSLSTNHCWADSEGTCEGNQEITRCPDGAACPPCCGIYCPFKNGGDWWAPACKYACWGTTEIRNFRCKGNMFTGFGVYGDSREPQVVHNIGLENIIEPATFRFTLPEGWKTTRIKYNTRYSSGSYGSNVLQSALGATAISTNLYAGSEFQVDTRLVAVGVTEDVNPPQVMNLDVSLDPICPGETVTFQGYYVDEDGATDIGDVQMAIIDQDTVSGLRNFDQWYARMSINLPQSGNPTFYLWGQNETYSEAVSAGSTNIDGFYHLNSDLTTSGSNVVLKGRDGEDYNSWVMLDGDQVIAHWVVEFDGSWNPDTYDLVLWTWDRDLREDEPGDLRITRPSGNPDEWEDFHYRGDLTVESCVADVTGTVYDASAYSSVTAACSNRGTLDGALGIQISCDGVDCDLSPNPQTSDPNYFFNDLLLGETYTFNSDSVGSDYDEVYFCTGEGQSRTIPNLTIPMTEDLVAFRGVSTAWWQAEIGDVHADGGGISSQIPGTCGEGDFDYCSAYILKNSDDDPPQQGLITATSGSFDPGEGEVNEAEWQAASDYAGEQTGYDYFWALAEDEEFDGILPISNPSGSLYSVNSNVSINDSWENFGGNVVVYIGDEDDADTNYDLEINSNITLDTDGFVAFIVSGSVTIAETVETVQAVIIADGTITIAGSGDNDLQFHGIGSFIAWGGLSFNRNMGYMGDSGDNRGDPSELFTYDPNIIRLAPDVLKKPAYSWIEVAP